jgi:nucleoside-diphosphate-sugar epimerase
MGERKSPQMLTAIMGTQEAQSSSWQGKKVLITGGAGFIGSTLAIRAVELGADVTVIDSLIPEYGGCLHNLEPVKDKVRINLSDIRDGHSMRPLIEDVDILFNLAGQTSHMDSMKDPHTDLSINCMAQLNLLEICRQFNPNIRIIFASTRQIYGKPNYLPVDKITASILWTSMASISILQSFITVFMVKCMGFALAYLG